ncbi:hypothetical protein VNO80_16196 [Phaseolus coccineus]
MKLSMGSFLLRKQTPPTHTRDSSRRRSVRFRRSSMADDFEFADKVPPSFDSVGNASKGFNPGLIVLLLVGGLMLIFLVGNFVLYTYAQKTLPPRRKKPVSKKKMKKERLKQGVSAPGE